MSRHPKLLSHRLRGFGHPEHSKEALIAACRSGVPYLEIDTRASASGTLYAHHDPHIHSATGQRIQFATTFDNDLPPMRPALLRLQELLEHFQANRQPHQTLCLDIKDYGFERTHLELIRSYELDNAVAYLSWCPQVLLRLRELNCRAPLILCHCNLLRFHALGRVFSFLCRNCISRLGHFVIIGSRHYQTSLDHLSHGYQHAYFTSHLPNDLIAALRHSGGGLCVSRHLLCRSLSMLCSTAELNLWTFTAPPQRHDRYLDDPALDVVFSDIAGQLIP